METTLQTPQIDLSANVLAKLSKKAMSSGQTLKSYIENILVSKASEDNPSPSGDPWFDDPENIKMLKRAEEQIERGEGRIYTMEEIHKILGV